MLNLNVPKAEHITVVTKPSEFQIDMDIIYHRIRIAIPRHNGKVERQHRIDELRFYKKMKMHSLEEGR